MIVGFLSGLFIFKFHYVSINSFKGITDYPQMVQFKFHYVSINSFAAGSGVNEATNHLNSIMFLLILRLQSQLVLFFDHLNSIMFLLILSFFASSVFCILYLNSIMFLLIHLSELTEIASMYVFKFHYVSINSIINNVTCNHYVHI